MNYRKVSSLILWMAIIGMWLSQNVFAETVTLNFTTPAGASSNQYFVSAWLTQGGVYKGTLGYWGSIKSKYYPEMTVFWAAIGKTSVAKNPSGVDARMGATLSGSPDTLALSSDVTNLPDGTYTINFETKSHSGTHITGSNFSFTKNGTAIPKTLQTVANFTGVYLTYDGRSVKTMTANSVASGQTATVHTTVGSPPSVIVKDASNNPVANVSVTFAVTSGGGVVSPTTAIVTNAAGIATLTSWQLGNIVGSNSVTATASGVSGSPITFTATGTAGSVTQVAVSAGNNQSAVVNTAVTTPPSVIIKDLYNNVVSGVTVTFAVASGGGSVTGPSVVTNTSGIATVGSWKLGTAAGTNTLTATVAGSGITGNPVTFTATGTAGAATQIAISASTNNQSATVNTGVASAPAVIIRDAFGNVKSGVAVTFTVASGGGTVVGGSATSNANGVAAVTSWTLGASAGTNTLSATSAGLTGSPLAFTATGIALLSNDLSLYAGIAQTATVGTAVSIVPTVRVLNGTTPISGVTITFSVSSGSGSVTNASAVTNALGVATSGGWTLGTTAGVMRLTASGAGLTNSPAIFTATAVAGAATQVAVNVGNNQSANVNTTVSAAPSVIVKDLYNNVVSGALVTFAVASGGGTITGPTATTNASGLATIGSWKLGTAAGTNTLTATVTGSGITGNPVTFTATGTAGAATQMAIYGATNNQSATVSTTVASDPAVMVRDAFGNPKSGVLVTFVVATGSGTVVGGSATSDASGIAAVTSWTLGSAAGTNTLTATSTGLTGSGLTFTATGVAATSNTLSIYAGDSQTATVGTAVAIIPTARVMNGITPVSGITIQFSVNAGNGSVTNVTAVTNAQGVATSGGWIVGTTTGTMHMTASGAGLINSPATYTATATTGSASQVAVNAGNNQSATVNTTVTTAPSVIVKDLYNNIVSGATVTFAIASGSGTLTSASTTTNASGIATVGSWKMGTAVGTNTVTATVSGSGISGNPVTFTATGTAGAATNMVIYGSTNNQSATVSTALASDPAVIVKDALGNPKSGVLVTFAVTTGGGVVVGGSATSDANGIATVTSWTLGSSAGMNTLTATSSGLTGSGLIFTATGIAIASNTLAVNSGDNQTAVVGTAVAVVPTVRVMNGTTPVSGITIQFSVSSGNGSVVNATAVTNALGVATSGGWILGTTVGTMQMTASGAGLTHSPIIFSATASAGSPASVTQFTGNNQTTEAGTSLPINPSVRVSDAYGNVVSGAVVHFSVTTGGGSITGATSTSNSSGIASVGSWTLGNVVGANSLSATVTGTSGVDFSATATVGVAAAIAKVSGDNQSAVAGEALLIDPLVQITDAHGNAITTGVTLTFSVSSGSGTIVSTTAISDGNGHASPGTWTLGTVAGSQTLTVSAAGLTSVTFSASAHAGPVAKISVYAGANQSAVGGTAVGIAPTVFVSDAHDNPVANITVDFTITVGSGSITNAHPVTGSNGLAAVTAWVLGGGAGDNTLIATTSSLPDDAATFDAQATADLNAVKMSVSFTTQSPNGTYSPENVIVVWVQKTDGTFLKTLGNWSGLRRSSLTTWTSKSGGGDTDAVMGATRSSHAGVLTVTWDLIPHGSSAAVPDGDYVLCFEITDTEGGLSAFRPTTNFTVSGGSVPPIGPVTLGGISDLTVNQAITPAPVEETPGGCGAGSAYAFMLLFAFFAFRRLKE